MTSDRSPKLTTTATNVVRAVACAAMALIAFAAAPARAQLLGAVPHAREAEIGMGVAFWHETQDVKGSTELWRAQTHLASVLMRYAVTDRVVVGGEVLVANTQALSKQLHEDVPNSRVYLVGASLQVVLWKHGTQAVVAGASRSEGLQMLQEGGSGNWKNRTEAAMVHYQRSVRAGGHEVTLWAGPAYLKSVDDEVPSADWPHHKRATSIRTVGAAYGIDVVWASRVRTFLTMVITSGVQPRAGLAVRFR